jgi:hypothetical protein
MTISQVSPAMRPFDLGRVLGRAFAIVVRGFVPGFLVVMSIGLVSTIINVALTAAFMGVLLSGTGAERSNSPATLIPAIVSLIGFALQYAAATCVTTRIADGLVSGEGRSIGALFAWTFPRLFPVAVTGFFYLIAYMIGLFLLVIPAIFVRLFFIVAGPARAVERITWVEAFGRSASLTENHRAAIFGTQFLWGVILTVMFYAALIAVGLSFAGVGMALPGMGTPQDASYGLMSILVLFVMSLLFAAVFVVLMLLNAALPASVYVELRDLKEGGGAREIEQVFA